MKNAGLFGRLPAELRNHIYELVLRDDKAIHIKRIPKERNLAKGFDLFDSKDEPVPSALTYTCRVIREEATPIFCANNVFLLNVLSRNRPLGGLEDLLQSRLELLRQLYMPKSIWAWWELHFKAKAECRIVVRQDLAEELWSAMSMNEVAWASRFLEVKLTL